MQKESKHKGGAGADRAADETASMDCGNMSPPENVQLEGEVENLMRSVVSDLFNTVPEQTKDHQVVEATVVQTLRLGLVGCLEKRTSPTSGRVINLTAHAGALPAAESAGTGWSLRALPARAATWGAKHAAQAAVVAAGGENLPTALLACSAANCLPALLNRHACRSQRGCTKC